jgi:hypothetical protein
MYWPLIPDTMYIYSRSFDPPSFAKHSTGPCTSWMSSARANQSSTSAELRPDHRLIDVRLLSNMDKKVPSTYHCLAFIQLGLGTTYLSPASVVAK